MLPRPGGSGKSKDDGSLMLDELEVVIVHPKNSQNGRAVAGQTRINSCCHRHGTRKRHNATQTASTHLDSCCCCSCSTNCFAHGELELSCHCHITHHHHCHHHYSSAATVESTKRRAIVRQRRHHHHHHQHRHHHSHRSRCHQQQQHKPQKHCSSQRQHKHDQRSLPVTGNKSSLDSSENHSRQMPHMMQAIAIEIDAATMTEDNSSTATSNFPYKVASEGGGVPIIMAPLREHHRQRRRGSLNSNTTIETDELSRDDDEDDDDDVRIVQHLDADDDDDDDEAQLTPQRNLRANGQPTSSSSTARACATKLPRNECVKIKRKRFMPDAVQDYCSSCSRCSSCSCEPERTSSCSSIDELADDLHAHELTVAAECHHCNMQEPEVDHAASNLITTAPSRHSIVSFCSCHTSSCCCCSSSACDEEEDYAADDDDEDETTGQRDSFCTAADHTILSTPLPGEGEDAHSSTLTPLTTQNNSLVEDNAEHTMRSEGDGAGLANADGNALTDADASSLSQSAEYFSLSSAAGPVQPTAPATPTKCCPVEPNACSHKPCKHWSKHHRHKRSSSPLDSHL